METTEIIVVAIGIACSFIMGFAKKKRFWVPAMIIYWGLIITVAFIN
jgi:hypothetical protein